MTRWLALSVALGFGCRAGRPSTAARPGAATPRPALRWLKGQTHLHSNRSGDSRTPPEEVVRWYARRGFDFLVFTDHDHVTHARGEGAMLVFPGVELTQNLRRCEPEVPGHPCLLHMNALFVDAPEGPVPWPATTGDARLARYARALGVARGMGGLTQLNHPNFHWAADAGLVTELARRGVTLVEIANRSSGCANEGDATHPSTEALWDAALREGVTLWGVATDDAHHYDDAAQARAAGEEVDVGDLGWVMVHASRDRASVRSALERGDFYASTGVALARLEVTDAAVELWVADGAPEPVRVEWVVDGARQAPVRAREARFARDGLRPGGYVRAVVTDGRGAQAWTQPVRRAVGG
ncbi:MAG: PHP domain-containing protein [Deltaproteobacteria bacterium]|nr:PHP domain-containing protein [Deltaproteobacteria bacterium]